MHNLNEIVNHLEITDAVGDLNISFKNVVFDSRKVNPGDLFVAIDGHTVDGHKFIQSAITSGARVIVCNYLPEHKVEKVTYISVSDSRDTLALLASIIYDNPSEKIDLYGITGTNGKTTVTFLINNLLKKLGYKTGIIGTTGIYKAGKKIESTHTTPDPLSINKLLAEMVDEGIEAVAMEVSSHALHQKRVKYLNYNVALFTNLTQDHLDYHKTMEDYALAKQILFNELSQDAYSVINADDEYSSLMIENTNSKTLSVGTRNADYAISNIDFDLTKSTFELAYDNKSISAETLLNGQFNIENISMAIAAVHVKTGIDLEKVINTAKSITGAPGRFDKIPLNNGAIAVIDYAHTPDSLEKITTACKSVLKSIGIGKLITIFGCGGDRDKTKRSKMAEAAEKQSDYIIITDDNPRTENREEIHKEIYSAIKNKSLCRIVKDRDIAIHKGIELSQNGDIILIAGKGHEEYQIIGTEKRHFSDYEEVQKANDKL